MKSVYVLIPSYKYNCEVFSFNKNADAIIECNSFEEADYERINLRNKKDLIYLVLEQKILFDLFGLRCCLIKNVL